MRVEYEAQGGRVTERFRVDFTGAELQALADLASLFTARIEDSDPLFDAVQRAAREWRLDQGGQPTLTSVPNDTAGSGCIPPAVITAEACSEGSGPE